MLKEWLADGERFPASIRTRWWTVKAALGLGSEVHAKTIRYTVATFMRAAGVPWADIEGQLGHSMRSQSGVYAKYAPGYLASATAAIEAHWEQALSAEQKWLADHLRTKVGNGRTEIMPRMAAKSLEM